MVCLLRACKLRPDSSATLERFETGRLEAMNYVVVFEKSKTGWAAYVPIFLE
jgi:hypothetical protein